MPTVSEVLAKVAQLSREELRELRREIDLLDRPSWTLRPSTAGPECRLTRLDDGEFIDLLRRSLAIEEDYWFHIRLYLDLERQGERLNFAEVYLTLRELTGESGTYLDPWKCSFSFPFALEVRRGERSHKYLLEVRNQRDSLYFPLRKIVDPEDKRLKEHLIHPPFADEFSREEINRFVAYLYGYLMGRWGVFRRRPLKPFLRKAASNLLVFGYCGGSTFEEQYQSEEAYDAACQRYEERIRQEVAASPQADACVVVEGGPGVSSAE
jgi:hypothetical protein